jgi:hypothetical protein
LVLLRGIHGQDVVVYLEPQVVERGPALLQLAEIRMERA